MAWVSLPLTDLFVLGFVKHSIFTKCSPVISFVVLHLKISMGWWGKTLGEGNEAGGSCYFPIVWAVWFPVSHLILGLVDK